MIKNMQAIESIKEKLVGLSYVQHENFLGKWKIGDNWSIRWR